MAWAAIWPSAAETAIFGSMAWIAENFGWYYVLIVSGFVLFSAWLVFSPMGDIVLGKDEDEVRVADISMHLLEALEKGEADRVAGMLETVED